MKHQHHHQHDHDGHNEDAQTAAMVTDPVCGMKVDPTKSKHPLEEDGHTVHFCSAGCLEKYRAEPQRFQGERSEKKPPRGDDKAIYTCPMHP